MAGSKRARTRAALIRAAARLVAKKGFDATSLDNVAAEAGMTRGAIYGNFKNREDLFLAVAQTYWSPLAPPLTPGASFRRQMHELAAALVATLPERRLRAVGAASFQLFALTNKRLLARLAKTNADVYRAAAQRVTENARLDELPLPPDKLVRVLHAMIDGLTFLHALTPHLIDEYVVIAAFDALAGHRSSSD